MHQRLLQKGATFKPDLDILNITVDADGPTIEARDIYTNASITLRGYDTVVLDVGNTADDDLYYQLKGRVQALYRTGDCVAPRGIDMAIMEGRKVGEQL